MHLDCTGAQSRVCALDSGGGEFARRASTMFMKLDQLEAWKTVQRVAGRCRLQEVAPSCADPKYRYRTHGEVGQPVSPTL